MSVETASSAPAIRPAKQVYKHALEPISGDEITRAADVVRSVWPPQTDLHFKAITLLEPPKAEVIPYLEAEHSGRSLPYIARKAFINYYLRNTVGVVSYAKGHQLIEKVESISRGDRKHIDRPNRT
jgi:primary-amine oxidase